MATALVDNPAWMARWHRSTAADLKSIGRDAAAAARIAKAEVLEAQVRGSGCSECGRQLTDPVSVDLGIGPECRRKGR